MAPQIDAMQIDVPSPQITNARNGGLIGVVVGVAACGKSLWVRRQFPHLPANCVYEDVHALAHAISENRPLVIMMAQSINQIPLEMRPHVAWWACMRGALPSLVRVKVGECVMYSALPQESQ